MGINSTILICNDHLDWIKRNHSVFVNGLVSRLEQGETDPYPGHSRWNGDAMPGVQVISSGHSDFPSVIIVGGNSGKKITGVSRTSAGHPTDVDALKAMANRLGYTVRKKAKYDSKPKQQQQSVHANSKRKRQQKKR